MLDNSYFLLGFSIDSFSSLACSPQIGSIICLLLVSFQLPSVLLNFSISVSIPHAFLLWKIYQQLLSQLRKCPQTFLSSFMSPLDDILFRCMDGMQLACCLNVDFSQKNLFHNPNVFPQENIDICLIFWLIMIFNFKIGSL